MEQEIQNTAVPSLYHVRCPKCGSANFRMIGLKGAAGKSLGVQLAFGAIGSLASSHSASGRVAVEPLQYQCDDCKEKFVAEPLQATPEEMLETPAVVNLERVKNFAGMAVPQIVYINGYKIGEVANGKVLSFQTPLRYNVLTVTDHFGVAFKTGTTRFEAQPGGTVNLKFNHKFV